MPANLTTHEQIGAVQTVSGNTPFTGSISEKSAQTFFQGVPVQLNAGFVQKWDGATIAAGILGFSLMPASNLASNGAGTPGLYSQVGPPGTSTTYGSVPYQASAVNIPLGAPMADGRTLFEAANSDTIFEGQFDNSAGAVAADYTPVITDIGKQYGMSFDATGFAYVDKAKATVGTNTVVQIVGINPNDLVQAGTPNTYVVNARVRFQVIASAQQVF
jgi:hypothetical protein